MNQALPSLHEKSLEITRTVPVRRRPDGTLLFRNIYVYLDTLKEYVMSIWTHSRSMLCLFGHTQGVCYVYLDTLKE